MIDNVSRLSDFSVLRRACRCCQCTQPVVDFVQAEIMATLLQIFIWTDSEGCPYHS